MRWQFLALCVGVMLFHIGFGAQVALAEESVLDEATAVDVLLIETEVVFDLKAVYATVESADVVTARARIGGTVATLNVDEGDDVVAGGVVAVVVDDRLVPQVRALDARVSALVAETSQAIVDRDRSEQLLERGVVAQSRFDDAQTRVNVVQGQLNAVRQERDVVIQQQREGEVLVPTAGVVLQVNVTEGSVVFAGEELATIASDNYVLRLQLPERHARFLKIGDEVQLEPGALGSLETPSGIIQKIFPQIANGRVVADVQVQGLEGYFVGERVRVWVATSERQVVLIPETFLETSYGVDYVTLLASDQQRRRVAVQRGRTNVDGRVEIIAGLGAGDKIVVP
jgi:RND family efflux transporter MFP subunit